MQIDHLKSKLEEYTQKFRDVRENLVILDAENKSLSQDLKKHQGIMHRLTKENRVLKKFYEHETGAIDPEQSLGAIVNNLDDRNMAGT